MTSEILLQLCFFSVVVLNENDMQLDWIDNGKQ